MQNRKRINEDSVKSIVGVQKEATSAVAIKGQIRFLKDDGNSKYKMNQSVLPVSQPSQVRF